MPTILPPDHFQSADTVSLARGLIGARLCRRQADGSLVEKVITETEAYDGPHDLACHASKGRTARTAVMFGPAGHWYVYLIYGMHEMLNLVTGPLDYPAAILIRSVQAISGPGRLTKQLEIDRSLNGKPATKATGLWIKDASSQPAVDNIQASPRIGIDYAGPDWSQRPYRFCLKQNLA